MLTNNGRVLVESSTLASAAYTPEATLEIEFRSGARYQYFGVPRSVFESLLAAESKGAYLNRHIKGRFPFARLGS